MTEFPTIRLPVPWPQNAEAALAEELRLRRRLSLDDPGPARSRIVAGLDAAYDMASDTVAGAAVVMDGETGEVLESATRVGLTGFPYVPGFLALRELPALASAWNALSRTTAPDLLLCDGYGVAHPRRCGLACWIGVLTNLPTIGVGKTRFVGDYAEPAGHRGAVTPIRQGEEIIGCSVRTQDGVKEVLVSVGNRVALDAACCHVLRLSCRYRLPEPLRAADQAARRALAEAVR